MSLIHLTTALTQMEYQNIQAVLMRNGIPFEVGQIPGPPPMQVFRVPRRFKTSAEKHLVAAGIELDPPLPKAPRDYDDTDEKGSVGFYLWLFWALACLAQSVIFVVDERLAQRWINWGAFIPERATEVWRWITTAFLHSSPAHAAGNAMAALLLGIPLWGRWGGRFTLFVFFAGVIGGDLAVLWLSEPYIRVIGASAGVSAFVGWLPFDAWAHRSDPKHGKRWAAAVLGLAVWFLPGLFTPVSSYGTPVSVAGHFGGWIAGTLLGIGLVVIQSLRRRTA